MSACPVWYIWASPGGCRASSGPTSHRCEPVWVLDLAGSSTVGADTRQHWGVRTAFFHPLSPGGRRIPSLFYLLMTQPGSHQTSRISQWKAGVEEGLSHLPSFWEMGEDTEVWETGPANVVPFMDSDWHLKAKEPYWNFSLPLLRRWCGWGWSPDLVTTGGLWLCVSCERGKVLVTLAFPLGQRRQHYILKDGEHVCSVVQAWM
jgi:hypothetical protein